MFGIKTSSACWTLVMCPEWNLSEGPETRSVLFSSQLLESKSPAAIFLDFSLIPFKFVHSSENTLST